MVVRRSDKFTVETKKVEYYSDFTNNLDKNPLTGYLARVTNEESIKQSLQNLIMTNRYERPFQPWIGSKIQSLLFEPFDSVTSSMLREEIMMTIQNCEPRVDVADVHISGDDNNNVFVKVVFYILSMPDQEFSLDLLLKRVR